MGAGARAAAVTGAARARRVFAAGRRAAVACAVLLALLASPGAHAQADPDKVLRVSIAVAETGFDPQAAGDAFSNYVNRAIFDPLYRYDYLARPYKLMPNTAQALPEISADGLTWTMRVRPGIYFADDPAFKGQRRELVAADYVYAIKRILDPKLRSNQLTVVDGRFVGADAVVARARETGKFDYDAPIDGLQATNRYTLRFRLAFPDYELMANLTTSGMAAVAREVVEAYGDASGWVMANPVGTGPYRLHEWRRGQRIVLEANPGFRDELYPQPAAAADRALAAKLVGRKLPLIGRIEISVIEESSPRLLAFGQNQLDYLVVPVDLVPKVLDAGNRLLPQYAQAGVRLQREVLPAMSYLYFSFDDPVVGGYTPDKIALRRAVAMAYDVDEDIRVIRQGQGMPATQVVPPGMSGHDPGLASRRTYDPAAARALLDRMGYRDRNGDGLRELPDGSPLKLKMYSTPSAIDRQNDELWQKNMAAVGIDVEFVKQKWPDLLKAARLGQLQTWRLGGINTHPEGFGFFGLLYGPNGGFANLARFKLAEYDRLYVAARSLPDGAERQKLTRQMNDIVRNYAPWVLLAFRVDSVVVQPWVLGYKFNPNWLHPWAYLDVDTKARATASSK
jgi:ABC-type transport system substrate-binding protein